MKGRCSRHINLLLSDVCLLKTIRAINFIRTALYILFFCFILALKKRDPLSIFQPKILRGSKADVFLQQQKRIGRLEHYAANASKTL